MRRIPAVVVLVVPCIWPMILMAEVTVAFHNGSFRKNCRRHLNGRTSTVKLTTTSHATLRQRLLHVPTRHLPRTNGAASCSRLFHSSKSFSRSGGSITATTDTNNEHNLSRDSSWNMVVHVIAPVVGFLLHSFLVALLLVTWEDVTCSWVLPSRQHRIMALRTSLAEHRQDDNSVTTQNHGAFRHNKVGNLAVGWGQSTIRGMGFGREDRLRLAAVAEAEAKDDDEPSMAMEQKLLQSRPSYNEVMLFHRTVRVPQWQADRLQKTPSPLPAPPPLLLGDSEISAASVSGGMLSPLDMSDAIHTLCACLASLFDLRDNLITNYQWDTVRTTLTSSPWSDLEWAGSRLRPVDEAVGFDWGSCAWRGGSGSSNLAGVVGGGGNGGRQCNALADAQEALDELQSLLGVLEPYEALFCLDVVERSLRDMLVSVPWNEYGQTEDRVFWQTQVPPYKPHRVFEPISTINSIGTASSSSSSSSTAVMEDVNNSDSDKIDMAYLEALKALRID
ncbi:hypothetical protein ACA910_018509 [Epithemia clementina (nom. ined.)]